MKVFKFIPPYNPKTKKPNFPSRGKAGVYLIKEEGNIVYVGYSSKDLYKTMYRHFQRWDHPTQEVITYAGDLDKLEFTVRVVYCTPKQAEALEKALIKKHKPRDNAQKYEDTLLTVYDRAAMENYGTEIPETPKFTKRELEVMEEDRRYFEERAGQSKAIFGSKKTRDINYEKSIQDYQYFIIDLQNTKALSGWSNKEDATEAIKDMPTGHYKIVHLKHLVNYRIKDPRPEWI